MKGKTETEKIAFLKKEGASLTIEQLMFTLELTRGRLYGMCIRNGIQPRDSNWCCNERNGEKPYKKEAIQRVAGEYSNQTPFGIAKH